jgi:hypothetical protein
MISVMPSALFLLVLSSGGEAALTIDGAKPVAVARVSADEPAPVTKGADGAVAPAKRGRSAKTVPPCTTIKRSPFEPPAEIDPVPPPVEGTEPATPKPQAD